MYEKRNQAYTMHPDFFDPLHQYASLEMNPKDPEFVKVQYHHEEPSVTVNEDGSVTFYMYAPKAATVAVGGMADSSVQTKYILLLMGREDSEQRYRIFLMLCIITCGMWMMCPYATQRLA